MAQVLDGHTNNICVVDAMYYADRKSSNKLLTLMASASVDSTVRIWTRQCDFNLNKECKFELEQVITAKMNGFALCLKFYFLPVSKCK